MEGSIEFDDLLTKYNALQIENNRLKKEVSRLKKVFGEIDFDTGNVGNSTQSLQYLTSEAQPHQDISPNLADIINKSSKPAEKIRLFMSLFRGRDDVYAKRWENTRKGTSGYSPACSNEWISGICQKPTISCNACKHKEYIPLTEDVVDNHLRGLNNSVIGIYPLLKDETCHFMAIDFDETGWHSDIKTIREVCCSFDIPFAVERSRSGNGAHVWFFFDRSISALIARKFGSAILTFAMSQRHEISFKSYDRLFPNQDTMPKGGFGNLIALPLQKAARKSGNSVFINEHFQSYEDQWAFLASIRKLPEEEIESLILKMCHGNELGILKKDEEETTKPWETTKIILQKKDFPARLEITKANMLFITKEGISQRGLNHLKRLAAFKNPEFYRAQAMRMPVFNKPRIICCAEETSGYLGLPRGCEEDMNSLSKEIGFEILWFDKTNLGKKINVEFCGMLREDQPFAVEKMLQHDNGVLCGTTAFGKTIAAIKLIAERKVNTLILVNKISLVEQWKQKLTEFLIINETIPIKDTSKGKRRKNNIGIIGQMGGGKHTLNGIIDIAVMQSLNKTGEINDCVKDYGMVIVDECHHVSAFSFEQILKNVHAKFVYGLTATPTRKDGHHPIIIMQCGPIRFRDDARKQAAKRPFDHFVIPRFTSFRTPEWFDRDKKDVSIHELYAEIVLDVMRNQQIIDDVVHCHENGRNCIVLTERTAHVEIIAKELCTRITEVFSVMGSTSVKEAKETINSISHVSADKPITIVSTGRYIGEGFDEPRLDTLFIAMPISWKGTLQQYAGRLHRLYEGKSEVQFYDYVDIHVTMFEKMYNRRLSGYASIGYKIKGDISGAENLDIIFDKNNFLPVYSNDIKNAKREIMILSPFITEKRTKYILQNLKQALVNNIIVSVITRPAGDFPGKNLSSWNDTIELLKLAGVILVFKSNIHQKFSIIDQRIVWYGSINLLSYGNSEESIMRINSTNIAFELMKSIDKQD